MRLGLWCPFGSWECSLSDSAGQVSVLFFFSIVVAVTTIHTLIQVITGTVYWDDKKTERHGGGSWYKKARLGVLLSGFFPILWIKSSHIGLFHPVQYPPLQFAGLVLNAACSIAFTVVHLDMGKNWSPVPEAKKDHGLVTHGIFGVARHPMYATFAIAAIGIWMSTLDWTISGYYTVLVAYIVIHRIPHEEAILHETFGDTYIEYCKQVGVMGPRWLMDTLGLRTELDYKASTLEKKKMK
mmetsp:Transcript_7833/g.12181  ORF Transcript_7833/g.12181 Transcript_7833/m.12181 type:complete len:240 (-) Transcript_7833:20-739(-)